MIRFFSTLLVLSLANMSMGQETDLYSIKSSSKFANYLFGSGNFEQAAVEYERLILLDSASSDSFKHLALVSYRKAELLETALNRIDSWHPKAASESEFRAPFASEYALCLTGLGYYNDAIDFLNKNSNIDSDHKFLLESINYSYLGEWTKAKEKLEFIKQESITKDVLSKGIDKGLGLKLKKPGLAATLSIVPGLGRVYTGNYIDAGLSVLVIGTFTWQAYTGFDQNGITSVYGWLTGGIATGFYFGNIYGSYRAAQLINKQKIEAILFEVDRAYSLID
ncbi:MAG: hypothetical protein JXQ87_12460 [Bacteroidia bacterium]